MNSISKIATFAGVVVLIFAVKMFFFSAFFVVEGTENIPQNIYEYSHAQYSSTEKLKRIREVNFDEWLEANVHVESAKSFSKKLTNFVCHFQVYQLFSFIGSTGKASNVSPLYRSLNLSALLNDRSYLRFQKLIL
jgi:predicted PurR-regulated permease PerM